jgi:ADP-heptose:LPS heptosyltransferase
MLRLLRSLRREGFDLAVELRGDLRNILFTYLTGAQRRVGFAITGGAYLLTDVVPHEGMIGDHQLEGNLDVVRHIGCDVTDNLPELATRRPRVSPSLAVDGKRRIAIHPCASKNEKLWPASHWARLIGQLARDPSLEIVLLRGPSQRDRDILDSIARQLHGCDLYVPATGSIEDFCEVLAAQHVLIGVDSFACHAAAALGTPFVALFGPSDPRFTRPYHYRGRVLCPPSGSMTDIEADRVLECVQDVITWRRPRR